MHGWGLSERISCLQLSLLLTGSPSATKLSHTAFGSGVPCHPAHEPWGWVCSLAQPGVRKSRCYSPGHLKEQPVGRIQQQERFCSCQTHPQVFS